LRQNQSFLRQIFR